MIKMKPSYEIIDMKESAQLMRFLERVARVCYKSEERIGEGSDVALLRKLIDSGHEAMIEHEKITVLFICDRGVSHEIVRHRMASFAQESTRYVNYSKGKYDSQIRVIEPSYWTPEKEKAKMEIWLTAMAEDEKHYMDLIALGAKPQEARAVLSNSLKTELIVTMNIRELRHFCRLRAAMGAHPQMREIVIPLLNELKEKLPVLFGDIQP